MKISLLQTTGLFITASSIRFCAHALPQDQPKDALPDRLDIQLHQFTLIPPTLNTTPDRDIDQPHDPTIIPFSGWCFFGPDGERQPWRKRSQAFYREDDGGQQGRSGAMNNDYEIRTLWRYPKAANAHRLWLNVPGDADDAISGGSSGQAKIPHPTHAFNEISFEIKNLKTVPDHFPLELTYLQGDGEVIAKADPDTKFPIGDERVQIEYLGPPRAESPAVKYAKEATDLQGNPIPYELHDLELHISEDYSHKEWRYQVAWFNKENQKINTGNGTLITNKNRYKLVNHGDEDSKIISHVQIHRLPVHSQRIEGLDLSPIIEKVFPGDTTPHRVEVTDKHRFGDSITVELQSFAGGADCLLDLDTGKVIALPDPAPRGDALAKFAHRHRADLYLYYDADHKRGKVRLQMLACPAYFVEQSYWTRTPSDCIELIQAEEHWPETNFWLSTEDAYPYLATTSDGSMVLFRETQARVDEQAGTATAGLEIRFLEAP
ncbi:MAG: hypothetical protein AAGI37_00635 [Planctomycetota bacterium]